MQLHLLIGPTYGRSINVHLSCYNALFLLWRPSVIYPTAGLGQSVFTDDKFSMFPHQTAFFTTVSKGSHRLK